MPVELRQLYPQRVYEFGDNDASLAIRHTTAGPALDVQTKRDNASNQVAIFRGGDRTTAADGDAAYISYTLEDSGGNQAEFARMAWTANDVTAATKDSKVVWSVQTGNTLTDVWEVSSSASGAVTTSFQTGEIILPDNVSLQLGNSGADADLSSNGTDIKWIFPSTADLILGRTGAPSPDTLLHLWTASAGSVNAATGTLLAIESSGNAYLNFLAPTASGLYFGDAASNSVGGLIYTHATNTLNVSVGGVNQLNWTDGTFAFQQSTTISSTGAITLNATGISGTTIKDEDNMATNSATHLASQQSIKAYVDAEVAKENELSEMDDVTISSIADNNHLQYDSNSSRWVNRTFLDFAKISAPSNPSVEEGRLYLREKNTANNVLAVKLQKASNIVEVELTSPGAICDECGSEDGAKDPTYDFQKGVIRVSLWCGHVYEIDLPRYRRVM